MAPTTNKYEVFQVLHICKGKEINAAIYFQQVVFTMEAGTNILNLKEQLNLKK